LILKPPTAASVQEKQNLQKEKRKSREATSYKSNRTTTTIKLCRNANTDSSWNSFQRRTYILKTTLPATGTKPLPFLHHHAKHKTQEGEKKKHIHTNTYKQLHYEKKSDVAENWKGCKLQFIVTATAASAKKEKNRETR
jgi:hypothetical protein